jgi:hypothetical protein
MPCMNSDLKSNKLSEKENDRRSFLKDITCKLNIELQ